MNTFIEPLLQMMTNIDNAVLSIYRQQIVNVQNKADNSPLSEADSLAHRMIVSQISMLTPSIPIVSEEEEISWQYRKPVGDFWLIDPLDGTKEFLNKRDDFTINIAYIRNGKALFGMVSAPALNTCYWGFEGQSFKKTGSQIQSIRVNPSSTTLRILASRSHLSAETAQFIQKIPNHTLIQAGSSLKFCSIAEGNADCYPRLSPTCEWDTAAAHAVLENAGGYVVMTDGTPLIYGKEDKLNPWFIAGCVPFDTLPSILATPFP